MVRSNIKNKLWTRIRITFREKFVISIFVLGLIVDRMWIRVTLQNK